MNRDLELLIQSYLDGELSDRKARRVADWIETDPQARALYGELTQTRTLLRGDVEVERVVPDTREFFWSGLERRIAQVEREKAATAKPISVGWLAGWRKYAAPLVAAALVALLAVPAWNYLGGDRGDPYLAYLAEVENLSEDMGSSSFRSQSGKMFVVWVYKRSPAMFDSADLGEEVALQ